MLDQQTRDEIRDRLIDEIAGLEERIVHLEQATAPVSPDKSIGRLSRLESMNEKSVNEAALLQNRERLTRLEKALMRVSEERFGVCVSCGNPIPPERLLLLPESTQCVQCASRSSG